jgi:hypothetical protein
MPYIFYMPEFLEDASAFLKKNQKKKKNPTGM